MTGSRPIVERLVLVAVALLVAAGMVAATVADPEPDASAFPEARAGQRPVDMPSPTATPSPTPPREPGPPASWIVTGPDGTAVLSEAGGVVDEIAAPGLTWPILAEEGDGYRVATHCARDAWVSADEVERPNVARDDGLAGAVIVVDAGHGGEDPGAVGPGGLLEADLNLAVAERLQALLEQGNDIDPDTGTVTPGDQHPPAAAVVMTRDADDGKAGVQRTALTFRGRLATVADASAFVSIHHNSGDTITFDEPASEVYYSVDDAQSGRLAGLVLEELRASFAPLADRWQGTTGSGTFGRADPDGTDYYTVLQEGKVPAVISEGLYISDPASEELAATEQFQQAYAEALYRALARFLESPEAEGAAVNQPSEYPDGESKGFDFSDCSLAVESSDDGA